MKEELELLYKEHPLNSLMEIVSVDMDEDLKKKTYSVKAQMSVKQTQDMIKIYKDLDPVEQVKAVLRDEFTQQLEKSLKATYLDVKEIKEVLLPEDFKKSNPSFEDKQKLANEILSHIKPGQKIICNVQMACFFQDHLMFVIHPVESSTIKRQSSALLYKVGKVDEVEFFVDPFMKCNDNRIFCCDFSKYKIEYNLDDSGMYYPSLEEIDAIDIENNEFAKVEISINSNYRIISNTSNFKVLNIPNDLILI